MKKGRFKKQRRHFKRKREDILSLRRAGLSYNQIARQLGCSKATISYHCGANNSEKKRVQQQVKAPLARKVNMFKSRCTKEAWRTFRTKIKGFKKRNKGVGKARTSWRVHNVSTPYNCNDVVRKISSHPRCYLTGRRINLNKPSTYSLDHIIPTARGGSNDLENLEITCIEANHAKGSLTLKEFYSLCEEILAWRDKKANKNGKKGRRSPKP